MNLILLTANMCTANMSHTVPDVGDVDIAAMKLKKTFTPPTTGPPQLAAGILSEKVGGV